MVLATILGQTTGPLIGGIQVDVALSESHRTTAQVTEHPIETGASVSDHIRRLPDQVTIVGLMSNYPASLRESIALKASGDTAERRWAQLQSIAANGEVVTLSTSIRSYRDMVMTELTIDRNASVGTSIQFRAVLRQLELSDALDPQPYTASEPDDRTINKPAKVGQKSKTPASDSVAEKSRSALSNLTGGTSGAAAAAALLSF